MRNGTTLHHDNWYRESNQHSQMKPTLDRNVGKLQYQNQKDVYPSHLQMSLALKKTNTDK